MVVRADLKLTILLRQHPEWRDFRPIPLYHHCLLHSLSKPFNQLNTTVPLYKGKGEGSLRDLFLFVVCLLKQGLHL